MPILAVVWHSWPLSCNGWLRTDSRLRRDAFDVIAFGGFLENDDEFVAAEPRHDVARAQRLAQPAGDLDQQDIAGVMPKQIVDDLEPVEIDEEHRKLPLVAVRGLDRIVEQLVERFPVGEIGQTVVRGEVFDTVVGLGLFVRAVEVLKGERHVVGQPLQEFDEFRRKASFSADI